MAEIAMDSFRQIKGTSVGDQKGGMLKTYSKCLRSQGNDQVCVNCKAPLSYYRGMQGNSSAHSLKPEARMTGMNSEECVFVCDECARVCVCGNGERLFTVMTLGTHAH